MIHSLQGMLSSLTSGLTSHLEQWIGWATLVAAALLGFRSEPLWVPLLVAVIINPMPYELLVGLLHGRNPGLESFGSYTAVQIVIAYLGYLVGRMLLRFR